MGRHPSNPNLNECGELHFKYRQQMNFLKELANELGVVMFRPSYHAQTGDCNTVLFYFKEDDEYNRKVDRENPGIARNEEPDVSQTVLFVCEHRP